MHHLCFEVKDIQAAIEVVKKDGIRVLNEPQPGAHGLPVVFMHPKDTFGCLLEFEEVS